MRSLSPPRRHRQTLPRRQQRPPGIAGTRTPDLKGKVNASKRLLPVGD